MLKEKLLHNLQSLQPWIKKEKIEAFRLYERDLKQYPLVIDIYKDKAHIQIYESSDTKDFVLKEESIQALKEVLKITEINCFFKIRRKQKEGTQYEKIANTKEKFIVREYGIQYHVNLQDYIDTGIFLDHRETRKILPEYLKGVKRLLNLFSYTGAFNLVAAKNGVEYTTAVDMSNTYCEWARTNFQLNGLDKFKHIAIRENVMFFLENIKTKKWRFDFIVIDPPTVSRSKKMLYKFDIQRDYIFLINTSLDYLNPGGKILFSTNFRKFKLDSTKIPAHVEDITPRTFPPDFKDPKIHKVFLIYKDEC
jgi:23S rRNA (cytosine1962-C5)-methyltransferase